MRETAFSTLRRMVPDRTGLVTTRAIVRAPIIADAAKTALFSASFDLAASIWPAWTSTSFRNASVAAARVFESARANSPARAASGQPSRVLSRRLVLTSSSFRASQRHHDLVD